MPSNSPLNHFISTTIVSEQRLNVTIGVYESDSHRQCKSSQVAALAITQTTEQQQTTFSPSANIWKQLYTTQITDGHQDSQALSSQKPEQHR
jgi:hypothetical protein